MVGDDARSAWGAHREGAAAADGDEEEGHIVDGQHGLGLEEREGTREAMRLEGQRHARTEQQGEDLIRVVEHV
jgi:hypothetical protein